RQRMCVEFRDGAARGPAGMPETVVRDGAVRAGRMLEIRQVAYRADVIGPAVLAQRDPGGVVAAALEPLEPTQLQVLGGPATDVSDDPAHRSSSRSFSGTAKARLVVPSRRRDGQPSSRRTRAAMLPQRLAASTSSRASASTRTTGSVPDGRTSTRPRPWSSAL